MHTKTYYTIFLAFFFLSLGLFSSPTIVSGYHILISIPAVFLFYKGERLKLSLSGWVLITLFVWGIVCTSVNIEDLVNANKSFQELKFYFFAVACTLPMHYFLIHAPSRHIRFLLGTLYFVLIVAFFVGILKAYYGYDIVKWRVVEGSGRSGGFLHCMRYGYGSAFLFLLGVGIAKNRNLLRGILNKKYIFMAIGLCFLAIFAAKTRGALLAVLIGLPFYYLKYRPKIAGLVIAIGACFAGVVIYFSFINQGNAPSRFLNINDNSNNIRASQFYTAVKAIQEKPIFGWGADQFSHNVTDLKTKYDIWAKNYSGHSHNIFLEHGVSFGLFGAFLLLVFLGTWFVEMISLRSAFGWTISTYIVAFVAAGQVELLFDNLNSHLLFFLYSLSQVVPSLKRDFSKA